MISNVKNDNFIGFVIAKIVELDILYFFIACLVPELANFKFFKMAIGSHFANCIIKNSFWGGGTGLILFSIP